MARPRRSSKSADVYSASRTNESKSDSEPTHLSKAEPNVGALKNKMDTFPGKGLLRCLLRCHSLYLNCEYNMSVRLGMIKVQ